ncbi:MAG: rhomboid family intramembrane serine protease [Fluviicola sp.]
MFANIPPVIKNLVLLNIVVFIGVEIMEFRGVFLRNILNAYPINSPFFQPYQIVSHMFLHANIGHIFLNMLGLVFFGSMLERVWGPKRFFIFYFASGIGAYFIFEGVSMFQVQQAVQHLASLGFDPDAVFYRMKDLASIYGDGRTTIATNDPGINEAIQHLSILYASGSQGASGAIFGVAAGFAILFPNTQIQLLFPPIPIRAKYLVGAYFAIELYLTFNKAADDHVGHLAHVGGAIIGAILVLIWRKKGKNFY